MILSAGIYIYIYSQHATLQCAHCLNQERGGVLFRNMTSVGNNTYLTDLPHRAGSGILRHVSWCILIHWQTWHPVAKWCINCVHQICMHKVLFYFPFVWLYHQFLLVYLNVLFRVADTGVFVWLPCCKRSNPEEYGWNYLVTKQSKIHQSVDRLYDSSDSSEVTNGIQVKMLVPPLYISPTEIRALFY